MRRQLCRRVPDDDRHVNTLARTLLRYRDELLVIAPRVARPVPPSWRFDRRDLREADGRRRGSRDDGEVGLIDAIELVGVRMHVNEPRPAAPWLQHRVRTQRRLAPG